jgi:hypothetical protein
MIKNVFITLIATVLITIIFFIIPNKSNISDYVMIPIIVALSVKYIFGDWDIGSKYSWSDVLYFALIICMSILTLKILEN